MTKEELLQDWLPRLWGALIHVRAGSPADAEEDLYELYVEMRQQTLAEKLETFSEITLEDQLSAMAIELQSAQKRVADLELKICQRHFEAKQEQGEPVAWICKRKDGGSPFVYTEYQLHELGYGNISVPPFDKIAPLYTTPQQRTWVGLTIEEREQIQQECFGKVPHHVAFAHAIETKLKEKNA